MWYYNTKIKGAPTSASNQGQSDFFMKNKHYYLALNRIYRIGPLTIIKLLKRWPELQEMFELSSPALEKAGLPLVLAQAIANFDMASIEADLRWEEVENQHLITWADVEYPPLLKEIHDPPVVLYAKGNLRAFKQTTVAMVGTRKPSVTGSETARFFARELSARNITIVSGLALGIDAQAHQGCLDSQGKTIAVMGTGIDTIYPARHRVLASEICQNGLLLSEFPLKTQPIAGHFPRRNRIISGLSMVTLIVEAAIKSGSLITARLAIEQNRDVLAIPGSIHNPQTRGCHHLLQQGAKLVSSIQDVLDEVNIGYPVISNKNKEFISDVTKQVSYTHKLVQWIGFELTTVDQIVQRSGLDVCHVACGLADLELQGVIKFVTGGYMRCVNERNII